jgi:hypothetical protein
MIVSLMVVFALALVPKASKAAPGPLNNGTVNFAALDSYMDFLHTSGYRIVAVVPYHIGTAEYYRIYYYPVQ